MSKPSLFNLLSRKRFLPLFGTQFLGAFNDNLFKAGLFVIFASSPLLVDNQIHTFNNLATVLLSIPFLLFSPTAGTLADHFEKSTLIRYVKIGELIIAGLIVWALITQQPWLLLTVVFLLGAQSAFFGPLKFSVLPQHLKKIELTGGNALIAGGTLVAILMGLVLGPLLAESGASESTVVNTPWALAVCVSVAAITGLIFAWFVPKAPSVYEGTPKWNPLSEAMSVFRLATEKKAVFQSILGVSWFWALGAVYTAQFVKLSTDHLYGDSGVFSLLLATTTLAIAAGSVTCGQLSRRRIEIGLVPIGAIFVSIFGIDLYYAIQAIPVQEELRNAGEFLTSVSSLRVLVDIVLIGFFLGMYLVPLQTTIQARTPIDRRARVIAANNMLNAIMLAIFVGGISIFWLTVLNWGIPSLLLFMAILNIFVSLYIFVQVPEFTLRFVVWILSHTLYRIRHKGLHFVPERGAALIACNHVSYIDALVLMGAIGRPVRFVMSKAVFKIPVLNYLFRAAKTIPIAPKSEDPRTYHQAFDDIRAALDSGDLVCIFPEGRCTPDGDIGEFKPGTLKILTNNPIPVIPTALCGLWGSKFTHHGKGLWRGRLKLWSTLVVKLEAPIEGSKVDLPKLRAQILAMRGTHL